MIQVSTTPFQVTMATRVSLASAAGKAVKKRRPPAILPTLLVILLCLQNPSKGQDVRLKVTTVKVEPYVMPRHDDVIDQQGVVRYQGYMVDLMDRICQMLGLRYDMTAVEDGEYGQQGIDGGWNGMIRELLEKRAELAVAPLYVTDQRQEVVDFSIPFIVVQATVLISKTFSPGEQKINEEHSRTISMETGNHVDSDNHMTSPLEIKTVADLLNRPDVIFGTLNQGMLLRSFRSTNNSLYKTIYEKMKQFHPSVFTSTNEKGIEWVRQGYQYPTQDGGSSADPVVRVRPLKMKYRRSRSTTAQTDCLIRHAREMNISHHHLHHHHHNHHLLHRCRKYLNSTTLPKINPSIVDSVGRRLSLRSTDHRGRPDRKHLRRDMQSIVSTQISTTLLNISTPTITVTLPLNHVTKNKSTRSRHHHRATQGGGSKTQKDRRPNHFHPSQIPPKLFHNTTSPYHHLQQHRIQYAFILPHTIGDYVSRQQPCDLIAVDRFLMREKFALAVPKGSGLLVQLNKALSKLKEDGFLDDLYSKWITDDSKCAGRSISSEPLISDHQMFSDGRVQSNQPGGDQIIQADGGATPQPSANKIFTSIVHLLTVIRIIDS